MFSPLKAVALLVTGLGIVHGRSLSYRMRPSEPRACFYAYVDPNVHLPSALLQFYFSASAARGTDTVFADAEVIDPSGQQLNKQTQQSHAEINIKPTRPGEYALCIMHHGAPSEKNIDVDITLPLPPHNTGQQKEAAKLEAAVDNLGGELTKLGRTMHSIRDRERRNLNTVEAIQDWIFYLSLFELLLIAGMSVLQVTVLRMFFSNSSKQRV